METRARAHALYAQGVIHDLNEEKSAAIESFYQAALLDPGNEDLVLDLTRRLLQEKQSERALEVLERSAKRSDASGEIYGRLGLVCAQLGKTESAMRASQTAIQLAPWSLVGYRNLFSLHLQENRPADAAKVLERAAKQDSVDADYLLDLAELYVFLERQAPARKEQARANMLAVLNRVADLKPEKPHQQLKLADGFNMLGKPNRAAPIYARLLERFADFSPLREGIRAKLIEIYLRNKDRTNATEQLEAMVKNDPTNVQAYYHLGGLAYEAQKLKEAREYFEKALLLNPDFEPAYFDLASVQIALDEPAAALETLGKARKKFETRFLAEFLTGFAHYRQDEYSEAIRYYTAAEIIAKAKEPERLTHFFYFQLGAACERNGDIEEAEKHLQKCLELSPEFAEALNYLGYMWADRGVNLEQARQYIEQALKHEPENAAFIDSLAWVLFRLNQHEAALEQMNKAIALSEEPDATLFDHLGDIYAALNQTDKAREAWQKSLEVEPNETIRKKLEASRVK